MGVWADALIAELDGLREWPAPHHRAALDQVTRGIVLRDRLEPELRYLTGWDTGKRASQRLVRDPMPSRISSAFASLVFGREPEFRAANDDDQQRMDDLVDENNFRSELMRAARTASSEGEAWWRIYVDQDASQHPLVEWHSRTSVYPLWRGARLMAVGFVSRYVHPTDDHLVYRHFEVHDWTPGEGGEVTNVLYEEKVSRVENATARAAGTRAAPNRQKHRLGERVPLSSHPDTANLLPEWKHGLPGMLAGRVANLIETDPTLGLSDYTQIEDWLLELTVAASIGHSNLELTARKRVLLPESDLDADTGTADVGEQVLVERAAERELGEQTGGSGSRFKVLEYEFDAEALIAWTRHLERTSCNRVGLDVQYAGIEPAEGQAESGVALRIRLIPSSAAGDERGQDWDDKLPRMMVMLQLVEGLPADDEKRGFGRTWTSPAEPPSIDRGATLPEDRVEATDRRGSAVESNVMSHRRAIAEDLDVDVDDPEVEEEWQRIVEEAEELATSTAASFGGTFAPPGEETEGDGALEAPLAEEQPPGQP